MCRLVTRVRVAFSGRCDQSGAFRCCDGLPDSHGDGPHVGVEGVVDEDPQIRTQAVSPVRTWPVCECLVLRNGGVCVVEAPECARDSLLGETGSQRLRGAPHERVGDVAAFLGIRARFEEDPQERQDPVRVR